jgi:hypothetical protein
MNRLELVRWARQEMRAILRMSPLLLASLALAAILWGTDSAAITGLFQSSPVEPPPSSTPTSAVPAATATEPVASPTLTVTVALTETVAPVETPTEALPTETAAPTNTSTPTEPPPTDTPEIPAASETAEPEATSDESQRYPEEESKLRFEWGMLFDSLALFFSYTWLCCGILVFLAVPVLFVVLWRASNRRQEKDLPASSQEDGPREEGPQQED